MAGACGTDLDPVARKSRALMSVLFAFLTTRAAVGTAIEQLLQYVWRFLASAHSRNRRTDVGGGVRVVISCSSWGLWEWLSLPNCGCGGIRVRRLT
jgi:hypothetical protein